MKSLHEEAFSYGLEPFGRPFFPEIGRIQRIDDGQFLLPEIHGPDAGICSLRVEELVGTFGALGDGHAIAGRVVALPLQLEVEPHAELLRRFVVDDLRTFQNASSFYVVPSLVLYAERYAAVMPVQEVFRGVASHPDEGVARMVRLMFAEPIVRTLVLQDASAVSVDVIPVLVGPQLARLD